MRFLHISDIHYNPEGDGRSARNLRNYLPEFIRKNKLEADELFVTGDYRHAFFQKDAPEEETAANAVEYIWKIAEAAGITEADHIHLAPGNHDRRRSEGAAAERYEKIQKAYDYAKGTFSTEDLKFLKSEFSFFYTVCGRLYGAKDPWKDQPLHQYEVVGNMILLTLNTAVMHVSDSSRGKLIIGNNELACLLEEIKAQHPQCPIIVLAHHALEYLSPEERQAVESIFQDYPVRLYLCGDAHNVWWRSAGNHLEITMGCLKQETGAQAAFLYGDTRTQTYTAYQWDGKFGAKTGWSEYGQFNDSIREKTALPTRVRLTGKMVTENQELLKNDLLLPWMKQSASFRGLFPKLFITPNLRGQKVKRSIPYRSLREQYRNKHIVISGDAGFGKTTLLKYLYLFENQSREFLYLHASALQREEMTPYERCVAGYLRGEARPSQHRIILLDGMDEVSDTRFFDGLPKLLSRLSEPGSNTTVWFGWRTEHYYHQESPDLSRYIENVITLQKWDFRMAERYARNYAKQTRNEKLLEDFNKAMDVNPAMTGFTETPFQLTLLIYLLENDGLTGGVVQSLVTADQPLYLLYHAFFRCWLKKERARKTSCMTDDKIMDALQGIAQELYYGPCCSVRYQDTAITGLLTFSGFSEDGAKTATGFYHRSLCAYFYAESVFTAFQQGGAAVVRVLRQTLRNDITDYVRGAISTIRDEEELRRLQKNLMDIYLYTVRPDESSLDAETRSLLDNLSGEGLFSLKNELLYFVTRLPMLSKDIPEFVEKAYECERDPYLKLDLAYGAVLTGPSRIALEYAKTLIPGSEADLVHRSWTIAYFGDVQGKPHQYKDVENAPWPKARKARLDRFQSKKKKAIRFRILDFPILYCFYESRGWCDLNREDLKIIQAAAIDCKEYSEEEKAYLKEQKEKLVSKYEEQLKRQAAAGRRSLSGK